MGDPPPEEVPWHGLKIEEVLARQDATAHGLSGGQVRERLERYGENRLPAPERSGPWKLFLRQFHNVLIYVLLAAAGGTAFLDHWVDTGVILGVVLINAVVGFLQEGKAEEALDAIRGMLSPKALVLRDGQRRTIPAEELVPGDLVFLQAGDKVPADLRLLRAHNMRVNEAMLTGESVAVDKRAEPVAPDADLGDRDSMAFSGTLVAFGQGRGVVVATGSATQIGRISTLLEEVETLTTPLLRDIGVFGRWLSVAILVLAGVTFAFGYWVRDYELVETFLAAVSLAVAAIPEGLPAIMTITLAIGVQRMAGRNAIIRRLPAVETLGSVTTICSDKTGTLTRNEMTVQNIVTAEDTFGVSGVGYEPHGGFSLEGRDVEPADHPVLAEALRAILLCNDAEIHNRDGEWVLEGDPTEGALVTAALKGQLDPRETGELYPRDDVIPFEAAYKFMVTLHHHHAGDHSFLFLKGAPERVLALCDKERTRDGGARPIDTGRWERRMEAEASRGQRLLAVAVKDVEADKRALEFGDVEEGGLTLVAVCGIIDPPREEAIQAVRECQEAGIRVKMITGDHGVTARAVAEDLKIRTAGGVVAGHELEGLSAEELERAVREVDVFARATPEHKLRLVEAIQADGHVVAVTGDGVNDAPALKRADVGVAMGVKGTEASKEAAEMVLADDNFASIANAVEEGRTVYDNLRKAILFLLPTSGGEGFTIMAAILLGVTLPFTPVQVLWVNMVTAVTLGLALAFEPTEPGVMRRPPRPPETPILSGFLIWRVAFVSALLLAGTFGHYLWMEWQEAEVEIARTVAINTLVMGELVYLFNSRYILESVLNPAGLLGSRAVLLAVGVLVVLQALFTYAPPMQFLFGTAPLRLEEWGIILVFGVALFLVVELEKAFFRHRRQRVP
ncbi:carbonate dehydratase [Thiohalorhabdus denitrificans]|uniref:ATPase, P-type (Transporting), HAD superfamily, subfamily IC n=1 Tax=Thiohalorhabdus denitrificans TaxID=381306 RepID=A0A0P9ET22_9GAMM|nr:cation-transporting P-type ATPase [Thiohalorhabdus denitrificans]KPV41873.1 carbonate dehydratase [Thiohalorhabdus denitrificans]SCY65061.1 ATPase, P-type (transporting), HAD superfamily, subfamily IC [Thiohalorhabdus denitrificans]